MNMSDAHVRIERFRKMAHEDPDNELGHFSLGRAYLDAGMHDEAIACFERVIRLRGDFSRAYHLSATALLAKGLRQQAIDMLASGVKIAHLHGDAAAREDMLRMLRDLGASPPALEPRQPPRQPADGEVLCRRCGTTGQRMSRAPFRGELGQTIASAVCEGCWRQWLDMGVKVINELRLNLTDPAARRIYDQHMMDFLNLR